MYFCLYVVFSCVEHSFYYGKVEIKSAFNLAKGKKMLLKRHKAHRFPTPLSLIRQFLSLFLVIGEQDFIANISDTRRVKLILKEKETFTENSTFRFQV